MSTPETPSESSIDEVIDEILDDKAPSRAISRAEARNVLSRLYAEHDELDATLPALAEREGTPISCRSGCTHCCELLILISIPEADALAESLQAEPGAVVRFLRRAELWEREAGDLPQRTAEALHSGSRGELARLEREHGLRRLMCPLNQQGRCTVYASRPLACRQSWAVSNPEHCVPNADATAATVELLSSQHYDLFTRNARRLATGLQLAQHGTAQRAPLVPLLRRRLAAAA